MTTQPLPFSLVLNDACDGYHLSFGKTKLRDCRIAVATPEIETEYAVDLELSHHGGASIVKGHSSLGIVTLNVAPKTDADAVGVVLSSQLDLTRPCRWLELAPLAAVHVSDVSHVLCHGRSMGGCQLLPLGQGTPRTEFESHFQCMLTCDSHRRLHLSHPLMQQHPSSVRGLADEGGVHELRVPTRMDFPTPGCLQSESLTLLETGHGFAAMTAWADSQQVSPLPDTPQPAGWNSWDYYRWTITEDEVLANADFIASDPVLSRHVKRIIVDDGWQYCHGEWEANSLFPSGMASLAQKLRGMGFIPGLWFAPTIAEPHSRIAQWHTHMLARAESDKPCICFDCMRRYGFSLDPTREDVKQWLYDLFDRYASMGYGYFKLDFLRTTLKARRFHRNVPRGTMMREIVTPIAAAVEGRADLLGCNYSYDGGNDLVRMVRAGSDIHATWGETKRNVVALAARFWAGNRLWVLDPDFAVCRGPDTSDDPDLGRLRCLYVAINPEDTNPEVTPGRSYDDGLDSIRLPEAQVLLSLVVIYGGVVNLSDKLTVLNQFGLDLLRRTVAARRGGAPLPLDLFQSARPSYWLQKLHDGGRRVLLINWEDEERDLRLDLAPHGIAARRGRDFWTDQNHPIADDCIRATLPPHHGLMLELEP